MGNIKQQTYLFVAWLIAFSALLITLYGSIILKLPVCHLCWFQRICIYPLTIILGIAAFKNDISATIYILPFPVLGIGFALYHYLEQMLPNFAPIAVCSPGIPCSNIHIQYFGFITYPFLSILCCLAIIVFVFLATKSKSD